MLAGLDGLTDEERDMLSIWVPARWLVWIVSTGFPHYLICRGMCMCADLLKSRSSEIQGGSPDDLPRFGRLNGIRRASLIPFNHQSGSKCKSSTLLLVCGFVTTNNGFLRQHPGCAPYTKHYSFGEDERLAATRGLCSRYHDFVNTITLGVTDK
jgi:hypothetical protein